MLGVVGLPIPILVVDDNPFIRAAMREVLEGAHQGWDIVDAENGDEAIEKAIELSPRLIIMDLVMPATDGLAASRTLTKLLPNTPILMHTMYLSPRLELEAKKLGVRKVIPKTDSIGLMAAVKEVLNSDASHTILTKSSPGVPDSVETIIGSPLEETIRELCAQLSAIEDEKEHAAVLAELRNALHRQIEYLRSMVARYPIETPDETAAEQDSATKQ